MENYFMLRTNEHIQRVQKNAQKIGEIPLIKIAKKHDLSKFSDDEYIPYIHLTWKYKLQAEGKTYILPKEIQEKVDNAWIHHKNNNRHHPEFWDSSPGKTDASVMPDVYIGEMVCDWVAMSQELENSNDASNWIEKNVGKRWEFSPYQKDLIDYYHNILQ